MNGVSVASIAVAAAAAFVTSALWYMLMPDLAERQGAPHATSTATTATAQRPPAAKLLGEFVRCLTVAGVIAAMIDAIAMDGWLPLLGWSFALWVGFPAVLPAGSVMWDNVAGRTAAIHAGDWLIKLTVITLIVGRWN